MDEMKELQAMLERATEYLEVAQENLLVEPPRRYVAYDAARHAAEVAGKALLKHKDGSYPRKHEIGGVLYQSGLVPKGIEPRRLSDFLARHTRAPYGFQQDVISLTEIEEAIEMARLLIASARELIG